MVAEVAGRSRRARLNRAALRAARFDGALQAGRDPGAHGGYLLGRHPEGAARLCPGFHRSPGLGFHLVAPDGCGAET